jgi:hypothetical protein
MIIEFPGPAAPSHAAAHISHQGRRCRSRARPQYGARPPSGAIQPSWKALKPI